MKNLLNGWVVLVLSVVVASCGQMEFKESTYGTKNETAEKLTPKRLSAGEIKAVRKKWEASPDGIKFKEWEASPNGQKVLAAAAKIRLPVSESTPMEAVVTLLTLPPGSRLGFGIMVRIREDDFILSFGQDSSNEFQNLRNLKPGDTIKIKSHFVSCAPRYAYPIVSGDYVERAGKILYKRAARKDGC